MKAISRRVFALALAMLLPLCAGCSRESNRNMILITNTGMAHFTFNIKDGKKERIPARIDDIIPQKAALVASLLDKEYTIMEFDTALDSDIPAQRVLAQKEERFVDICYGLTEEQAVTALPQYKTSYEAFYLMAQNEKYVYCVSDTEAFDDAGFTSLANIGTQYIYR